MISLTYTSMATNSFDDDGLKALLKQSRQNNANANITGLLLYDRKRFVQMLEGDEHAVNELYLKITSDPRNSQYTVLNRSEISDRVFSEWSMAYRRVSDSDRNTIEGYEDIIGKLDQSSSMVFEADSIKKIMYSYINVL